MRKLWETSSQKNGGGGEGVGYQIDDTKYAKEGGVL